MKVSKDSNNSNPTSKVTTKRPHAAHDKDMIYSFKTVPINRALIDKWIVEVIEYANIGYNKFISGFYRSKGLTNSMYKNLVNRNPDFKDAHEEAMRIMGERLWSRAVDKDADWSAVKHRLHSYAAEFAYDDTYHAKLKADADQSANGNKEYIYEKIIEYREKPKDE